MDFRIQYIIRNEASKWLSKNPERLSHLEIEKFKNSLDEYLFGNSKTIDDEVYDFLVDAKLIKNPTRHSQFAQYLNKKYSKTSVNSILDVGAGRCCHLSKELTDFGFKMSVQDPKIRLTDKEIKRLGIIEGFRTRFECDEYSSSGKGTNIQKYDALVGLEPCMATEHIIRQGLAYDKPFDVLLCYEKHNALNGKGFSEPEEWFDYLKGISKDVDIIKQGSSFIATNSSVMEAGNE